MVKKPFLKPFQVASTRVNSAEASHWTVRNQSSQISSVQDVSSGGSSALQLQNEVTALTEEEREVILRLQVTEISPENSLALKTGALLPWKKVRIMLL